MKSTEDLLPNAYGHMSLYIAIGVLVLVLVAMLDSAPYEKQDKDYTVAGTTRAGSLILPTNTEKPRALMIFVHGDGAMGRSAFGYYYPLWQQLAKQGIASYSWDKAGVGGSTGNWLNQTMQDRVDEILAAIAVLRQQSQLRDIPIGLIGFSQAGWVMPKALNDSSEIELAIFVSTPVNWLKQSEFLTHTRLTKEDLSDDAKLQQMRNELSVTDLIVQGKPYSAYLEFLQQNPTQDAENAMTSERYHFVQQNILSDSQQDLMSLKQPIFVAFGNHDHNVNVPYNVTLFKQIFAHKSQQLNLKVYPNANHTLLKNSEFGHLSPSIWWLIKMSLWEADGFSNEFIDDIMQWLNTQWVHHASQKLIK